MKNIFAIFLCDSLRNLCALCGFVLILSANANAQLENIQLKTLEGKDFSAAELNKNKASVVVFLLADCPACISYSLTLNKLNEKFATSGISFYGVFPGTYNTNEEMKTYRNEYKINFTLLEDQDKILVKYLNAQIAPQAFLLNDAGNILYSGRVDDWMYAVGKRRLKITHHELEDALNDFIHSQKIKIAKTNAVGCIIE